MSFTQRELSFLFFLSCLNFDRIVPLIFQVELPKFSQLKLLYPGYYLHGGSYRDNQIITMVGGNHSHALSSVHNTSPLRLSWTLNRYGGRHAIGHEPVDTSDKGIASTSGSDGQEYIYRSVAFGPFLALKYGEPLAVRPPRHDVTAAMETFHGKQGIIQFLSYGHQHTGGHVGLWDCDHLFQAKDWTAVQHIISIQLWETPGEQLNLKSSYL